MVTCMGTFIAAIESPRWLLSRGRVIDAQHSCAKMNGSNAIDSLHEMQDIKTDLDRTSPEGSTSRFLWFDLISKTKLSLATIVCSCLIVIQTVLILERKLQVLKIFLLVSCYIFRVLAGQFCD